MQPKDLLVFLQKGNRTDEHLEKIRPESIAITYSQIVSSLQSQGLAQASQSFQFDPRAAFPWGLSGQTWTTNKTTTFLGQ